MIFGIGIDEIEVARIEKQIQKEAGFIQRVFTSGEIEYCESKKYRAQHYAARFAAKEAFMKAVGTGWRDGLAFNEIEIVRDELGRPALVLYGKAKEITDRHKITNIHVSLSHIKELANAIVTLEK